MSSGRDGSERVVGRSAPRTTRLRVVQTRTTRNRGHNGFKRRLEIWHLEIVPRLPPSAVDERSPNCRSLHRECECAVHRALSARADAGRRPLSRPAPAERVAVADGRLHVPVGRSPGERGRTPSPAVASTSSPSSPVPERRERACVFAQASSPTLELRYDCHEARMLPPRSAWPSPHPSLNNDPDVRRMATGRGLRRHPHDAAATFRTVRSTGTEPAPRGEMVIASIAPRCAGRLAGVPPARPPRRSARADRPPLGRPSDHAPLLT